MELERHIRYIAFYDLDHTILNVNSATCLFEEARRRKVMSDDHVRQALWLSMKYKMGLGEPATIINRMLGWLSGLSEESVSQMCREVFRQSLIAAIRPEIRRDMDDHRSKGGANVLLSSATALICEPVSQHLGLDDVICTHLVQREGILTGHTEGLLVYGIEKKNRMLDYCSSKGFDPGEAYYYGDSYTDRYVMEAAGFPVAVSPDKRLLKIARKKNWPILVLDR
jgi:HAD superfamily hydrolase (TIGR01490 family)